MGLLGNNSKSSVHKSDLSSSLNLRPISKIAYQKCGNGKSLDVDTQSEARVGGVFYCFPSRIQGGGEKGVTNNNSCIQQIHNRYKKQIQAYKFTLTIKATSGLV
jgi:hypothetical protein